MKTLILKLTFIFSLTGVSYYSYAQNQCEINKIERDKMIDLSVKVHDDNVYFKLLMLNESKGGMYSLIREFDDGSSESVGLKEIAVNTINKPVWYSFVDKSDNKPVSYKLLRISDKVELVSLWHCSEIGEGICVDEAIVEN